MINVISLLILMSFSLEAKVISQKIIYKQGGTTLEGYFTYDDSLKGPLPGVVVVHNWMGLTEATQRKAKELAELGYVAFAADIYGKDVRAKDSTEASKLAGIYYGNRKLLRDRALAAVNELKKTKQVDRNKIAAIGFCFGGTTVLEAALSGASLKGVVSFHGGLNFPESLSDASKIKAKVLVLHGAIDPFVPEADIKNFTAALNLAKTDYQFVSYANAVHSFTDEDAGSDITKGAAYNPAAHRRSFEAMKIFLKEIFL